LTGDEQDRFLGWLDLIPGTTLEVTSAAAGGAGAAVTEFAVVGSMHIKDAIGAAEC